MYNALCRTSVLGVHHLYRSPDLWWTPKLFTQLVYITCYPRAARWPRSGHTLSIQILCKNYGSVWRVPSTITALSSDYNSYCHSNWSYATSLRPIRAYIYTIQYRYDMYEKGKHRKFDMFDDIFARITIIREYPKQLYIHVDISRTGCCSRPQNSINKPREIRSLSANIHRRIQLLCFVVRYNIFYFQGIRYCESLST